MMIEMMVAGCGTPLAAQEEDGYGDGGDGDHKNSACGDGGVGGAAGGAVASAGRLGHQGQ